MYETASGAQILLNNWRIEWVTVDLPLLTYRFYFTADQSHSLSTLIFACPIALSISLPADSGNLKIVRIRGMDSSFSSRRGCDGVCVWLFESE